MRLYAQICWFCATDNDVVPMDLAHCRRSYWGKRRCFSVNYPYPVQIRQTFSWQGNTPFGFYRYREDVRHANGNRKKTNGFMRITAASAGRAKIAFVDPLVNQENTKKSACAKRRQVNDLILSDAL